MGSSARNSSLPRLTVLVGRFFRLCTGDLMAVHNVQAMSGDDALDGIADLGDVKFTRRQYEYLNRCFAEVIGSSNTTDAELRINQGRRQVIQFIRERCQ